MAYVKRRKVPLVAAPPRPRFVGPLRDCVAAFFFLEFSNLIYGFLPSLCCCVSRPRASLGEARRSPEWSSTVTASNIQGCTASALDDSREKLHAGVSFRKKNVHKKTNRGPCQAWAQLFHPLSLSIIVSLALQRLAREIRFVQSERTTTSVVPELQRKANSLLISLLSYHPEPEGAVPFRPSSLSFGSFPFTLYSTGLSRHTGHPPLTPSTAHSQPHPNPLTSPRSAPFHPPPRAEKKKCPLLHRTNTS